MTHQQSLRPQQVPCRCFYLFVAHSCFAPYLCLLARWCASILVRTVSSAPSDADAGELRLGMRGWRAITRAPRSGWAERVLGDLQPEYGGAVYLLVRSCCTPVLGREGVGPWPIFSRKMEHAGRYRRGGLDGRLACHICISDDANTDGSQYELYGHCLRRMDLPVSVKVSQTAGIYTHGALSSLNCVCHEYPVHMQSYNSMNCGM